MSLYQCEICGAQENTACGDYWGAKVKRCSECATGKWHGLFNKVMLPLGMFVTNEQGNLQHKDNGDIDLSKYEIKQNEQTNTRNN